MASQDQGPAAVALRAAWRHISRASLASLLGPDGPIDDPKMPDSGFVPSAPIPAEQIATALAHMRDQSDSRDAPTYTHPLAPGLVLAPGLLAASAQRAVLSRLLHRDLADPAHHTNLHAHHEFPPLPAQGQSLFSLDPDARALFIPCDLLAHAPLTPRQALDRRLHWLTLGGQYDWTRREYSRETSPTFPTDLHGLVSALFPATPRPDAAIVNVYRTTDSMGLHRDDAESAAAVGLVSLSFGSDGLFIIETSPTASTSTPCVTSSNGRSPRPYLLLRLRSGDAVYMAGQSRLAWHGVPRILPDTCPSYLEDWPASEEGDYNAWLGWMRNKRVNFNVRQMNV